MVEENELNRKYCICDDKEIASAKFMHGWRYCAYCGVHLDTKLKVMFKKG